VSRGPKQKCLDFDGLPGHPDPAGPSPHELMARMQQRRRLDLVQMSAAALLALSLAACATRNEAPAYAGVAPVEDDDSFCRQGGKVAVGSPDYVYCRKDRDAARNAAVNRADRKQRDLADWMLNHPN
jgi:hypothetical protein